MTDRAYRIILLLGVLLIFVMLWFALPTLTAPRMHARYPPKTLRNIILMNAEATVEEKWALKLCAQAAEDEAYARELRGVVDPDYEPLLRLTKGLCSILRARGPLPPPPPTPPPSPNPTGPST